MENNVINIEKALWPKSDQLNSIQIEKPIVVKILRVDYDPNRDRQQVWITCSSNASFVDAKRPFKPCKTVLRIFSKAWGIDASKWVGKSAELFTDENVVFKSEKVGGIRVSAVSHIAGNYLEFITLGTFGRKQSLKIKRLDVDIETKPYPEDRFSSNKEAFVEKIKSGAITIIDLKNKIKAGGFELTKEQEYDLTTVELEKYAPKEKDVQTDIEKEEDNIPFEA